MERCPRVVLLFALTALGCFGRVAAEPEADDAVAHDSHTTVASPDAAPVVDSSAPVDGTSPVDSADPVDAEPAPTGDTLAKSINVESMALSAEDVFWSDGPGSGSVFAVNKTGGPTRTIAKLGNTTALAVDGTDLYLAYGPDGFSTIGRMPLGGGPVTELAKLQRNPVSIAIRAGRMYWLNSWGSKGGALLSALLDGSDQRVLVPDLEQASNLIVTATDAYFREGDWGGGQRLMRYTLATGVTTTIASAFLFHHLAVQEDSLFHLTSPSTTRCDIVRRDHGVDAILASDSSGGYYPGCLVADATNLYFQFPSTGIVRMPIGGGTPVPFASTGPTTITAMVADDTRVYWGEQVVDDMTHVRAHAK